jgi:uncharacterized protein (TIGR02757 family)
MRDLKEGLESLRRKYETPEALILDPLSIPLRYRSPLDREVAAWVAAQLAYGRVAPMLRAIEGALAPLGASPSVWLREAGPEDLRHLKRGLLPWKWRFHAGSDLVQWYLAWKALDQESGGLGLEPHLLSGEDEDHNLSRLVQRLRHELPPSAGLRFSLPDPRSGSACKRWRMFLRWMIRPGWPDLGLWQSGCPSRLIIPLDTHVARVSRYIGLTRRRTPDGRMAEEITASLRLLDPEDPLKYDFAIAHLGILGDCPGLRRLPGCRACPLVDLCTAGEERSLITAGISRNP